MFVVFNLQGIDVQNDQVQHDDACRDQTQYVRDDAFQPMSAILPCGLTKSIVAAIDHEIMRRSTVQRVNNDPDTLSQIAGSLKIARL